MFNQLQDDDDLAELEAWASSTMNWEIQAFFTDELGHYGYLL
jgi:hypothetical protein